MKLQPNGMLYFSINSFFSYASRAQLIIRANGEYSIVLKAWVDKGIMEDKIDQYKIE